MDIVSARRFSIMLPMFCGRVHALLYWELGLLYRYRLTDDVAVCGVDPMAEEMEMCFASTIDLLSAFSAISFLLNSTVACTLVSSQL